MIVQFIHEVLVKWKKRCIAVIRRPNQLNYEAPVYYTDSFPDNNASQAFPGQNVQLRRTSYPLVWI